MTLPDPIGEPKAPLSPQALSELVSTPSALRRALESSTWQTQYCTTNYVALSNSYVLKHYQSRENFAVERAICSHHALFSFKMTRLIVSVDDPRAGMWNIFARVKGHTLHDRAPPSGWISQFIDSTVDALVSFEMTAREIPGIRFRTWKFVDGVFPLVSICQDRGHFATAETLFGLAGEGDRALEDARRVPCFDIFSRNVIWTLEGVGLSVTHIDFDKGNRLVLAGEQLSHLAIHPALNEHLSRAMRRYAVASKMDDGLVFRVCSVARFFRALAGVRDSMPRKEGAEAVEDAAARGRTRVELLKLARATAPEVISALRLDQSWVSRLNSALSDIESVAST